MEDLPRRKPMRLTGWDYSGQGMYFLTLCTHQKRCTLSSVRRGDPCGRPSLELTPLGQAVARAVSKVEQTYGVTIEKYVIMPNHVHILFTIPGGERRATARVAPTAGLVVGGLKSLTAHDYLAHCKAHSLQMGPLWQRGYHDHIVRDEADFLRVWTYLDENPAKWAEDTYYVKD